jgi:cold shock CspA family protein/CheY-like chemotaxis protein
MTKYKVFWIDDNHEKQSGFKEYASDLGVELFAHKSLEGLEDLFFNFRKYDAVLLDVKFNETDSCDLPPSNTHSMEAKNRINLFQKKKFPIVFFSGETDTFSNEEGWKKFIKEPVFQKGTQNKECVLKLIELSENQEFFQIKQNHKDFFEASKKILPTDCSNGVLTILADKNFEYKGYLNQIRKIIENGVFPALIEFEIIPNFKKEGWLTKCSKFIGGHVVENYEFTELVPEKISQSLRFLIKDFLNPSSHTFVNDTDNKYLTKAMCFMTMDIVIWASKIIKSNNKKRWKKYLNNGQVSALYKSYGFIKNKDFDQGIYFSFSSVKNEKSNEKIKLGDVVNFLVLKNNSNELNPYSAVNIEL